MERQFAPLALLFGLVCGLLVACGAPVATAPTASPEPPAPASPGLAATTSSELAAPLPSGPTPEQETAASLPAATTTAPSTGGGGLYDGLEQGRTAEGYQALGAVDAPVTLIMYSDFL
jgi:hypothetical protein